MNHTLKIKVANQENFSTGNVMEDSTMNGGEEQKTLSMDTKEIMEWIPHRYPMLLVDRLEEVILGESAVGVKNVTMNEWFFQGHFPGEPVMPGVLIVEAMAQTAAALVMRTLEKKAHDHVVYFMSVENGRFRRPVHPGSPLLLHVQKQYRRKNVWKFKGIGLVDGQVVSEAFYTAMITSREK